MRIVVYFVIALQLCGCDVINDSSYSVTFKNENNSFCNNCSSYNQSLQKVLNRNKRWFVFPKGGNALLTMVVTKTVIDGYPRGLQESLEMELGFSVPPWVEGWRKTPLLENNDKEVIKSVQAIPQVAQPKIDNVKNINYHEWRGYNGRQRTKWNPLFINQGKPPSESFISSRIYKNRHVRPWQYHREYRERRQVYKKFEALEKHLGINVKSCILRAICEVKNGLLPEGESFIQDVARIVFTVPLDLGFEDDYVSSARDEQTNCAKKFSISCPISPVELFLQSGIRQ